MEVTGLIHSIGEVKTFGQSFNKREFVVFVVNQQNSDWSDYLKLELTQSRCDILNGFAEGDEVKAHINLKGRLWTNKEGVEVCFNTIEAWKVEKLNVNMQQPAPQQTPLDDIMEQKEAKDDLPF